MIRAMGVVLAFAGAVGVLQGVAWIGGGRRVALGAVLAPVATVVFAAGLVLALVPGFFAG